MSGERIGEIPHASAGGIYKPYVFFQYFCGRDQRELYHITAPVIDSFSTLQ